MPIAINELHQINIGDYVEDCNFQPGVVTEKYDTPDTPNYGMVRIQSFVHGGMDGYCSVWDCGLRTLTEDEVMHWLISGPDDVDITGLNWWRKQSVFEIEPTKAPPRQARIPKHKYKQRRHKVDRRR